MNVAEALVGHDSLDWIVLVVDGINSGAADLLVAGQLVNCKANVRGVVDARSGGERFGIHDGAALGARRSTDGGDGLARDCGFAKGDLGRNSSGGRILGGALLMEGGQLILMAGARGVIQVGVCGGANDCDLGAVIALVAGGGDLGGDGVVILRGRDALLRSGVLDLGPAHWGRRVSCRQRNDFAAYHWCA